MTKPKPTDPSTLPPLVERICDGGCGKKFKVMESSKVTRARSDCDAVCKLLDRGERYFEYQNRKDYANRDTSKTKP